MKLNINGKIIEVADADLSKALEDKADSLDVKAEGFTLRTEEEEVKYKENVRREGISNGAEIGRKEVLKGLGIEGEGRYKSDDSAIKAIKSLIGNKTKEALSDANIEPNKKIETLESDLEALRTNLTAANELALSKENEFKNFKNGIAIDNDILKHIPDNTVLPKEKILALFKLDQKTGKDDNGNTIAFGNDGNPIKDSKTLEVLGIDTVVKSYFDNNPEYLSKPTGGAGGSDSSGDGGKKSFADFEKEQAEKGNTIGSPEYIAEMTTQMESGTLEA